MSPIHPLVVLLTGFWLGGPESGPRYEVIELKLPSPVEKLIPADLDGDGLRDLLVAENQRFEVYFQKAEGGFQFSKPDTQLPLGNVSGGADSIAWDVARLSKGGGQQVVAIVNGAEVKVWKINRETRRFLEGASLLRGLTAPLPRGFYHLPFVRDLDDDGDGDFVIPGSETDRIYLRGDGGTYSLQATVQSEMSWELDLDGEGNLASHISLSLSLPLFELRDVNRDSRKDLVSETEDRLEVYLAGSDGGSFPEKPSYSLDLAAERERLGTFDLDDLDFSNLTEALSRGVQVAFADINGDGIEDLMLRGGGRLVFFLGRKDGMNIQRAHQVLKASGNVLLALMEDENGDGHLDLWILRIQKVSLGDIFLWLVTSGSLEFDIFIYRNDGARFSRRPSRRLVIDLRFPSILSLVDDVKKRRDEEDREEKIPSYRADLAGSGNARDLVVFREGRLEGFLGKAEPLPEGAAPSRDDFSKRFILGILEKVGYSREKDAYEVELLELPDMASSAGGNLPDGLQDAKPELQIPLPGAGNEPGVFLLDWNGDGRDDFLLIYENSSSGLRGAVMISRS